MYHHLKKKFNLHYDNIQNSWQQWDMSWTKNFIDFVEVHTTDMICLHFFVTKNTNFLFDNILWNKSKNSRLNRSILLLEFFCQMSVELLPGQSLLSLSCDRLNSFLNKIIVQIEFQHDWHFLEGVEGDSSFSFSVQHSKSFSSSFLSWSMSLNKEINTIEWVSIYRNCSNPIHYP